jgi:hypothetical protein
LRDYKSSTIIIDESTRCADVRSIENLKLPESWGCLDVILGIGCFLKFEKLDSLSFQDDNYLTLYREQFKGEFVAKVKYF